MGKCGEEGEEGESKSGELSIRKGGSKASGVDGSTGVEGELGVNVRWNGEVGGRSEGHVGNKGPCASA